MQITKIKNRGSVAIISLLIISSILIISVLGMSEAQISGSTQYFNEYSDEVTYYMAEGCLEESMIRIEDDISFSGTTLPLQDGTCEIYVSGSAIKSIDINVTYLNYSQAFMAEVTVSNNGTANNARLISWKKV